MIFSFIISSSSILSLTRLAVKNKISCDQVFLGVACFRSASTGRALQGSGFASEAFGVKISRQKAFQAFFEK
ncbi:MAG: hypothetical protein JXR70_19905, partial [Spirochaetales bacterium]|nr:hypothetical protein [Spirochaetales bacterium]